MSIASVKSPSSEGVVAWIDERSREAGSLVFAGVATHRVSGLASRFVPVAPIKFFAGSRFIAPFALAGIGVMAWSSVRASQRYFGGSSQDRWHDGIQIFSAALAVGAIFGGAFRKMVPGFRLVHSAMVFGGLALDLVDLGHLTVQWKENPQQTSLQEVLIQAGLVCFFGLDRQTLLAARELCHSFTLREIVIPAGSVAMAGACLVAGSPEAAALSLAPLAATIGQSRPLPPRPPHPPGGPILKFYTPTTPILPNTVIFIDNRPKGPHMYHEMIGEALVLLRHLEGGRIPADLPAQYIQDASLREIVERGLREGRFKDTTLVSEWVDDMNQFAGFEGLRLPLLDLVVAHAERDIDDLLTKIVRNGARPAGVIFSGSPKMLSETATTDPVVMRTVELAKNLLQREIPTLGICFGMHLLVYARYGVLVEWITVPPNAHVVVNRPYNTTFMTPVTPGQRRMVFGIWSIKAKTVEHPVMRHCHSPKGLEVHSQHVPFPHPAIPSEAVLATSRLHYRPNRNAPAKDEFTQEMAEVVACGRVAVGTQLHPELTSELLMSLSWMPAIERQLRGEGHVPEVVRAGLLEYEDIERGNLRHYAGQRYGFNWAKYVLLPDRLQTLLKVHQRDRFRVQRLSDRLRELRELNPAIQLRRP